MAGSALHGKLGIVGIEKKMLNKFFVNTQLKEQGLRVIQVACSDYMTLILADQRQGRQVYCLGGQNTKTVGGSDPNEITLLEGDLLGKDIVQISCGDFHGAAIDSQGLLYTWGGGKKNTFNKG